MLNTSTVRKFQTKMRNRPSRPFLGLLVIVGAFLLVTCVPAGPPPTVDSASEPPASEPVEIEMWVSRPQVIPFQVVSEVLDKQLELFQEENPDINVEYQFIPYSDLLVKLTIAYEAGVLPDVVGVPPNSIQQLSRVLTALDDLREDDFLSIGLLSSSWEGKLFGLPWYREQPCSPFYYSLGVSSTSPYQDAAMKLVHFLTQPEVQSRTYELSETHMLPARETVYEDLRFECPPTGQVVVPSPDVQDQAVEIAIDRIKELQQVLDDNSQALMGLGVLEQMQAFGPHRSVPVVSYGEGGEPPSGEDRPPEPVWYGVATPVEVNFTREAFDEALRSESGVIVGAFFGVDESLRLQPEFGEVYTIGVGESFAVKWRSDDGKVATIYLVNGEGEEFERETIRLSDSTGGADIARSTLIHGQPFVTLQIGSCTVCYNIDFYSGCPSISEGAVAGFVSFIEQFGGTITYNSCN